MTIRRSTAALAVLSAVLLLLVTVAVAGAASQRAFVAKLTLTGDQEVSGEPGLCATDRLRRPRCRRHRARPDRPGTRPGLRPDRLDRYRRVRLGSAHPRPRDDAAGGADPRAVPDADARWGGQPGWRRQPRHVRDQPVRRCHRRQPVGVLPERPQLPVVQPGSDPIAAVRLTAHSRRQPSRWAAAQAAAHRPGCERSQHDGWESPSPAASAPIAEACSLDPHLSSTFSPSERLLSVDHASTPN